MPVRCSQCHKQFSLEGGHDEGAACPKCKAEAGLEPVKGVPPAMRAFGGLLAVVIIGAVTAELLARTLG